MKNQDRVCLVLSQYRDNSEYNDFLGKYYHFPKKHLSLLSSDNIEFVYFEPSKHGDGVYFGFGKIGKVFEDKREKDHYFAEINDYHSFAEQVPFLDESNQPRETEPFYNPQNAVRRIRPDRLDTICLDGGIILNFTADAHLMKVLGEQLIASEKVGILELIKNAYDAGASYCKVKIDKIPGLPNYDDRCKLYEAIEGPVIFIEDDGCGMDRFTIENGWLRPASPIKGHAKDRMKQEKEKAMKSGSLDFYNQYIKELKSEYSGRIPLGEKGVGRFATHRLGRYLRITTKTKETDFEYVLDIDWNEFDSGVSSSLKDLNSIGVSLRKQSMTREYGPKNSGTLLTIYGGKSELGLKRDTIIDIARSVASLTGKRDKTQFIPSFECPQLPEISEEVKSPLEECPPVFHLSAFVNENGFIEYDLLFTPTNRMQEVGLVAERITGNEDLKLFNREYWTTSGLTHRKPRSGDFIIDIDCWYRLNDLIDFPQKKQLLEYLSRYGGVSIFRDNLLILSTEEGNRDDWLGLSLRQIKQSFRLSYYHLMGEVLIDQTTNMDIVDKTNREGLIRNTAYDDLVELLRSAIWHILEPHYIGKRDEFTKRIRGLEKDPKKLAQRASSAASIISKISSNYDIDEDPLTLLSDVSVENRKSSLDMLALTLTNIQRSYDEINIVQEMMTEMAGYGLSISIAIHEIAKMASSFYYSIHDMIQSDQIDKSKLEAIAESLLSFRTELSRLEPQRILRNEPSKVFNIITPLNNQILVYKRRLDNAKIIVTFPVSEGFFVYTKYGMIAQIFGNLLDNSLYWLQENSEIDRQIYIGIDSDNRIIKIADNGPGIHPFMQKNLFQPGYSMKNPPSGLGLYICNYYLGVIKGTIRLATEEERVQGYSGATFILEFANVPDDKGSKK